MADTVECKMTEALTNQVCLNRIFRFLRPKDWISFAQVCKTWKLAAYSRELQTFVYAAYSAPLSMYDSDVEDKLNVAQFFEILEFVSPKLKYVEIIKKYRFGQINDAFVTVKFGRFTYFVILKKNEEELFMNIFLKQTMSIKTLNINTFDGGTKLEWEHFFQTNRLNHLQYTVEFLSYPTQDKSLFFDYISILPSSLEQIELIFDFRYMLNDDEQQIITQFMQRLPQLSKVHLDFGSGFSPVIATEITKRVNTIKELCLIQPLLDKTSEQYLKENESKILSVIPNCTSLTKLSLNGFTLHEDLCQQIAQNCHSIRCLKLHDSYLTEICFQVLTLMPNLNELCIPPLEMNLTNDMINLRRLIIQDARNMKELDFENVVTALVSMPNLSSLTLHPKIISLTNKAARKIKKIIHSRGQNIVIYSLLYIWEEKRCFFRKVGNIICESPISNKEFRISIAETTSRVENYLKIIKNA